MGGKGSGPSGARLGTKLAKELEDAREWERAWNKAVRDLFNVINEVSTYETHFTSHYVMMMIVRKWLGVATLEEVRAMVMEIKEEVGL